MCAAMCPFYIVPAVTWMQGHKFYNFLCNPYISKMTKLGIVCCKIRQR